MIAPRLNVGDEIKADIFAAGDKDRCKQVFAKGKGFAGPMKTWGLHRGPMTHGSKSKRVSGSMGYVLKPWTSFQG